MMKKVIQAQLQDTLRQSFPEQATIQPSVEVAAKPEFGDFSTNLAMQLAAKTHQSPRDVAGQIVQAIDQSPLMSSLELVSIAGPGFINFKLSTTSLWHAVLLFTQPDSVSSTRPGQGQTIMVEFSSPNIAKPFNVGHLRSTIIGDSLARVYGYLGYRVLRDNHLGDWGTQYGKLAVAVERWGDWTAIQVNPIRELFALYVKFHQLEADDPSLTEAGRQYFKRLEEGDSQARQVWQRLVDLSLAEFNQLYQLLDVHFDMMLGESFFASMSEQIIQECVDSGIARESDGALLIFFPNDELPPLMIRKSDGTSLYATRDLAAIKHRFATYHMDRLVYEVGNEQELAFRQVIKAAEMLGYVKPGQLAHVGHGLFMLPTGKMSTRKGQTVWISELIEELEEKALQVVAAKSPDMPLSQQRQVAQTVALGALKYNDLSQNRNSTVVFDKDKSLSLEGNSAPYLQYSVVRCHSILAQANRQSINVSVDALAPSVISRTQTLTASERRLLTTLIQFNDVVEQAAVEYLPSHIATYLFGLAQIFSSFYQSDSVLQADAEVRNTRLLLVQATATVLTQGLQLLGIQVLERM